MHGSMTSTTASKVAKCVVGLMLALGQQQVCGFSPIVASRHHMAHQCQPPARHRSASRATIQAVAINDAIAPVAGLLGVAALAIPLSIPIDQALQGGTSRIDSIANTVVRDGEGDEGVRCYVARPDTDEPRPVFFLTHQFFGLRPRDTELCDELARLGYAAVAPDCFKGQTTGVIPRAIWQVRKAAFDDEWDEHLRDFDRVVRWVERQPWADKTRMSVGGFCFGGGVALRYADMEPSKVKAVVVFYGRPLKSLKGLQAPVYGVFGSRDRQFGPEMVGEFDALLSAAGVPHEIRSYEGRTHAFVKDLADIRQGGDSGDAWNGMLDFLKANLK